MRAHQEKSIGTVLGLFLPIGILNKKKEIERVEILGDRPVLSMSDNKAIVGCNYK
jgi:hypothetical protein